MAKYREIFPKSHAFLAVIHTENAGQVVYNAHIAFGEGADGLFLVNHAVSHHLLGAFYNHLRDIFSTQWIGVNFLDLDPYEGLHYMRPGMNGMWVDNAGIYDEKERTAAEAGWLVTQRQLWEKRWNASFLYFGGVAFKYKHKVADPARAAQAAIPFVDVVTTSGEGTGVAADVEKIRAMKQAIGDHPLALASGYTPENAHLYNPYVQVAIVGTYLCEPGTEKFTVPRVRAMRNAIPS